MDPQAFIRATHSRGQRAKFRLQRLLYESSNHWTSKVFIVVLNSSTWYRLSIITVETTDVVWWCKVARYCQKKHLCRFQMCLTSNTKSVSLFFFPFFVLNLNQNTSCLSLSCLIGANKMTPEFTCLFRVISERHTSNMSANLCGIFFVTVEIRGGKKMNSGDDRSCSPCVKLYKSKVP